MPDESTRQLPPIRRPPEARLRLRFGTLEVNCGRERPLVRFGRTAENDVVIDDEFASRRHGEIVYRNGRFQLVDHSSNGTLIVRGTGRALHIQGETVLLEGTGSLRCGHFEGRQLDFAIEVQSGNGWTREEAAAEPPPVATNSMRREGDYWTLSYEGTTLRLKDAKGLRYLTRLLGEPGRSFHALELVTMDTVAAPAAGPADRTRDQSTHVDDGAGAGPLLDATARAAYKRRLNELREELDEAEGLNDRGRIEAARAEIEFVTHQLTSAVGLGGRDRESGSNAERARVAVTLRIKSSLQKIRNCHPSLGAHLLASVKTGRYCSYAPEPLPAPEWTLD